jgi:hypothetical protein
MAFMLARGNDKKEWNMSSLRDDIQNFINDLQDLLNQHQDDQAFVDAVKQKWSNEDDLRRGFIISCQEQGGLRLLDEGGEEDDDGSRPNEPVGRF